jgi:hypothetical protein
MIVKAQKRIIEAKSFLKKANNSYHDSEEFIININACIQALRNVTFLIQSQKTEISNFDVWYENSWRSALKSDKILKWLIDARNQIVKQEDLVMFSYVTVSLHNNYFSAPSFTFQLDPFLNNHEIAKLISISKPDIFYKDGYLKIERKWIENNCFQIELLRILTHCFLILNELVKDVEIQRGPIIYPEKFLSNTHNSFEDYLLITNNELKNLSDDEMKSNVNWYKLPEFEFVELKHFEVKRDESLLEELKKRYGDIHSVNCNSITFKEKFDTHIVNAKNIIKVDKFHMNSLFMMDKNRKGYFHNLIFSDITDKYHIWNDIYTFIKNNFIVELIFVSEIWIANVDTYSKQQVDSISKLLERAEALMIVGCNINDEFYSSINQFTRVNDEILFLEEIKSETEVPFYLLEIFKIWNNWKLTGMI